jgi:hypothetical protein
MSADLNRIPRWAWIVAPLLHMVLALYYRLSERVVMSAPNGDPGYWNTWWQTLEYDHLRQHLWQSLWYMHMQPPLYNLYGAFFIRLYPQDYFSAMHLANIGLGTAIGGLVYAILYRLTQQRKLALLGAGLMALNPALFLFEAHPLYTILSAFFLTLAVYCLAQYASQWQPAWAYAFMLSLNALMLTRSSYHLLLGVAAWGLVSLAARADWRRVSLISACILLLTAGWYAKNAYYYGFFGPSSWGGHNLFKAASAHYSAEEIRALGWAGVLGRPFQDFPLDFASPSKFWLYEGLYEQTSSIPSLSVEDPNNINIPIIAAMYGQNAQRLIRHDPAHYLGNVADAYDIYTRPSSQYGEVWHNAQRIRWHERLADDWLHGQNGIRWVSRALGHEWNGSVVFFLLPISLLGYLGGGMWQHQWRWRAWLRADLVMVFLTGLLLYSVLVSSVAEHGENNRFKFEVEALLLVYWIVLAWRAWAWWPIHIPKENAA